MRTVVAIVSLSVLLAPLRAAATEAEDAVQRAIIQLDQRTAEFQEQIQNSGMPEVRAVGPSARPEVGRPLSPDPEVARQLRGYERMREAGQQHEYVLRLPPPVVRDPSLTPLPLPGGPADVVQPVPATREPG